MAFRLTNESLAGLLKTLGLKPGDLVQNNHRRWRHPDSGCEFLLPANKIQESPRAADLVGIRAQLDLQGHLDEDAFDYFVAEGTLPVVPADNDRGA
ncbi:MAG TPA: hypothetical protein VF278_20080 [Pirellulales bacterium]